MGSYTSLTYHIVFSTKYRRPVLADPVRWETYGYVAGIIANKRCRRCAAKTNMKKALSGPMAYAIHLR